MVKLCETITSEVPGYSPTVLRQMIDDKGGLTAAKKLLNSQGPHYGFAQLRNHGRLDLSVEALVLQPQWAPGDQAERLFSEEQLAVARERLVDAGYDENR